MYRVIVVQKEQDAIRVFAGDLYGERGDCKLVVTKDGVTLSPAAQAFLDYALSAEAAPIIAQAGAVAANG